MILGQIPPEIAALFSQKTLLWITAVWVLVTNVGRARHFIASSGLKFLDAVTSRGGLRGMWGAMVYGTNTPKQISTISTIDNPVNTTTTNS